MPTVAGEAPMTHDIRLDLRIPTMPPTHSEMIAPVIPI